MVGDRRTIFDGFDIQSGSLQRRDRAFASATRAFYSDINFFDPKFGGLVSCLLGRTLTGKWRALTTAFESASSCTCPTQRLTLGIGDGHGCVVKGRMDVCDSIGDVSPYSAFFRFCHVLPFL